MNSSTLLLKENSKGWLYVKYAAFFALVYLPVFYNLDNLYIMIWDESRVACSSYEMNKTGNFFAVNYAGKLDDWSTKPVLLNWIQVIFIKLLSFSELAVRLPSALAGFITCVTILNFFKDRVNGLSLGFIVTLVLITSTGYTNSDHSVRTADYEGVLSVFMITGCLQFYIYVHEAKDKNILWCMLLFAGATMIKGPAGLFFAPSLFIYLLIRKQLLRTLKNKYFYIGVLLYVTLVGAIYFSREMAHPGYLKLFNEMEFLGRQGKAIEGHTGTFLFYYDAFVNSRFETWYALVPLGIIIGLFFSEDAFLKNFTLFFLILFIGFFLIISTAETKCNWYDFSLFPILAYFAALPIWFIYKFIATNTSFSKSSAYSKGFAFTFLFMLFLFPYIKAYNKAVDPGFPDDVKRFNAAQHYLKLKRPIIENCTIVVDAYCAQQLFYVYKHSMYKMKIENFYNRVYTPGEKVMAAEFNVNNFVEEKYNVEILDRFEYLRVYKIISKK
jgi:4-amino-4-deoxy-L-arabinose transferase-like glycosyltransferase